MPRLGWVALKFCGKMVLGQSSKGRECRPLEKVSGVFVGHNMQVAVLYVECGT